MAKKGSMASMSVDMVGQVVGQAVKTGRAGRPNRREEVGELKRLSLMIPPALHKRLKQEALDRDETMVNLAITAIEQLLSKGKA